MYSPPMYSVCACYIALDASRRRKQNVPAFKAFGKGKQWLQSRRIGAA
jgi:hypothetical protein